MEQIQTLLHGHNSEETAYVVDDYPYGFRLRCKIRYWIETSDKKSGGQRFMSQTSNPKKAGLVWNKPKASVYCDLRAMFLNEEGHVKCAGFYMQDAGEKLEDFLKKYEGVLTSAYERKTIRQAHYGKFLTRAVTRLAGGSIYDITDIKRRSEIMAEARLEAVKEVNKMEEIHG